MAKFNKDTFINHITDKVQLAIDRGLIKRSDSGDGEVNMLHAFIQYELVQYIEDRKFALDVLKDFNYDEKISWNKLEDRFGVFKSLMDLALVNLWKFLEAENATDFLYYKEAPDTSDVAMLDVAREDDDYNTSEDDDIDSEIENTDEVKHRRFRE